MYVCLLSGRVCLICVCACVRVCLTVLAPAPKPEMLRTLVNGNTLKAMDRLRSMAPQPVSPEEVTLPLLAGQIRCTVAVGAQRLVETAMDPNCLSRMEATWHAWF